MKDILVSGESRRRNKILLPFVLVGSKKPHGSSLTSSVISPTIDSCLGKTLHMYYSWRVV